MDFAYERYLALLEPFRLPPVPCPLPDARLPEWQWQPLRSYNGFGGEQRVQVWQLQRWAFDTGALPRPQVCSVCASGLQVGLHSENYADPWVSIPLCHACHMAVHGRFRHADAWARFQTRHHRRGVEQWFDVLPATPIDLAGWLIARSISSAYTTSAS